MPPACYTPAKARLEKGWIVVVRRRVWELVPTVILHLFAAGVNGAAAYGLGVSFGPIYTGALVAAVLALPVSALALTLAGHGRVGSALLALSFMASAALGLYGLLGLDLLITALSSPPGTGWKLVFFGTAAMLPLLEMRGILGAVRELVPAE